MHVLFRSSMSNLYFQIAPAARFVKAKYGNQQYAGPDQKELQHLIENCRSQASEGEITRYRASGQPNADVDVPAENNLQDRGNRKHVHATNQHGHESKRNSGK